MRDISLRLPYLIYLSIGSILVGVLLAPILREMPVTTPLSPAPMADHEAMHGTLEVAAADAPTLAIDVTEDAMDGWNVTVHAENFTFTPEDVNTDNVANTGHAHLYLNGVKMARLYGPYFHIPELPAGQHEVTVNLSSNDHSYYLVDGARIEARATITQDFGS